MTDTSLDATQLAASEIPAGADPFALFDEWFALAKTNEPNDPNAVAVATATPAGAPSVRMVLLKEHGPNDAPAEIGGGGFTFYTNSESRKGGEIRANMQASMLFHWKSLRRQIRIEGPLYEVTPGRADAYFHSRPFKSQVGSAASDQSRPLPGREIYIDRVEQLRAQYEAEGKVPRPPHWTGFTLVPQRIEFWLDRANRLHDRRQFSRTEDGGWSDALLYP
ncbi:MAG: pyridoxamine 5'-phosphate oxidase [Pseudomonadota bacterium]